MTEELAATGSGIIQRILVAEGETVAVNELLAVIGPAEADGPDGGEAQDWTPSTKERETWQLRPNPLPDRPTPWRLRPAAPAGRSHPAPGASPQTWESTLTRWSAPGPGGRVTEDDITEAAERA